jgi:hypothetical protein
MNLHLLVPALFWPDPALPEIYRDLPLPGLESLLAKCSVTEDKSEGIEGWLCRAFGVAKQQDWPVAPITLQTDSGEDGEAIKTEKSYWIRADPVHLRLERDHILLADSHIFRVSLEEAQQFTGLLNRHFAANQGINLFPLRPDRWYLRLPEPTLPHTHLLGEAVNRDIRNKLPFGANNTFWRSLVNEIQMLLHEHPLNQAREARGELAINSVWLWGGGTLPESLVSPYTHVWSNEILAVSLASACNIDHAPLPVDATVWEASVRTGRHLVVLDELQGRAQYRDAYGWRESIKEMERRWFDPLWRMFRGGQFDEIMFTAPDESSSKSFTATRSDSRKFWRRPRPILAYGK